MKLTKEECEKALVDVKYGFHFKYREFDTFKNGIKVLEQLINEHFDFFERNEHNHKPLIECEKWELLDCVKALFYQNKELKSNPPFELQLTSSECDLILFCLKEFEEEFGWDATLLIEKIENYKYIAHKQEGVVECVEID